MIFGLVRRGTDPSVNAIASLVLAGTTCVTILASRFISPSDLTG
jgi:ABC-type spermidine/putrescine transport system permease subunit II